MIRVVMVGGAVEDVRADDFFVKEGTLFFNRIIIDRDLHWGTVRERRERVHLAFAPGTWLRVER